MRRNRLGTLLTAVALLGTAACDAWYNDIPSPDDLMHIIPWFDSMIKQAAVYPYQRADVPRNTVPGTVPITGGEADWSAEWSVLNTTNVDKLVNPIKDRGASVVGDSLYHTYCAVCHGQSGAGDARVGMQLGALPLTSDRAKAFSDGYLYSIIRYGRGVMPKYGDKVHVIEKRWEIVNYVRMLQAGGSLTPAAPAATPAAEPAAAPGGKN
ncbi:MAG: cytochrome c [Gemmatimonadales bacterium]